ncbi:MAG: hypothetical protein J0G28_13265 [Afipia sp.]|nr:hypothetical protein [Afipia sp.]OJW61404.1 MAG: hypothetical protein BGO65_10280 [Afipia sp. 64-13]
MISDQKRRALRLDYLLAGIMVAMGLVVAGMSLYRLSERPQFAQVTPPPDAPPRTTAPAGKENGPAKSEPGGTRPTTPAPEPARPDPDAQKAGATPALPAAPPEKIGEPVQK